MSIPRLFIRRPIATSLLMAGILLVGASAYPFLPVALAAGRFPDHPGHDTASGADPVTMASRSPRRWSEQFARNPRRHANDLVERARRLSRSPSSSISAATSMRPQATSRPRSMRPAANCRRICPLRQPIAKSIRPIRRSWSWPSIPTRCHHRGRRLRGKHPGPEHQPNFRRRPGQYRRPAKARGTHPSRCAEARRNGT